MRYAPMKHETPNATFTSLTLMNAVPDNEKGKKEKLACTPGRRQQHDPSGP